MTAKLPPLPELIETAPERIWLGCFEHDDEPFPDDHEGITWCQDKIECCDVEYVRADVAKQAVRYALKRAAAAVSYQQDNGGDAVMAVRALLKEYK